MPNCSLLDEQKRETAVFIIGFLGLAATIVCFVATLLVAVFKLYRYFAHRLALYQVLAALLYGIALSLELPAVNYYRNETVYIPICKAVGFFAVYFAWLKLLFSSWVILHLFCFAVFYKNLQRLEPLFVLLAIIVPLLFVWVPFLHNSYGLAGPWCWIKNWRNDCINEKFSIGQIEQFALWYGPAIVSSVVDVVAIIIIIIVLVCHKQSDDQTSTPLITNSEQWRKVLKQLLPLLAYPIVFCIILLPPLANRILGAFPAESIPIDNYFLISAILVPFWVLLPALALIIHICVLKWPKQLCSQVRSHRKPTRYHYSTVMEEQVFTSVRDISTSCATVFDLPTESEVDGVTI